MKNDGLFHTVPQSWIIMLYPIVKLAEIAQRTEQGVMSVNVATNDLFDTLV